MNQPTSSDVTAPAAKPSGSRLWLKITLAVAACATAAALWVGLSRPNPAPKVPFQTINGAQIAAADLQGKVVFVNFWATSCVTCVAEMPMLAATHKKYASQGYETIAVAMKYDRPDYVLNFAKTRKLPFHVVLDLQGAAAQAFGDVKVTPTSFLIDRKGNIVETYVGQPHEAQFHQAIEKALRS